MFGWLDSVVAEGACDCLEFCVFFYDGVGFMVLVLGMCIGCV